MFQIQLIFQFAFLQYYYFYVHFSSHTHMQMCPFFLSFFFLNKRLHLLNSKEATCEGGLL